MTAEDRRRDSEIHIGVDYGVKDTTAVAVVRQALSGVIELLALQHFGAPHVPDWLRRELSLHRVTGAAQRSASPRSRKRALHLAGMRSTRVIRFRRWSPRAGAPKFPTVAEAAAWLKTQL